MSKGNHLGEFEHLVLLAVARLGEDGYGMSVRQEIEKRSGRDVSIGAVYATLDRLEKKSLVETREGSPSPMRGGKSKRHFSLSPTGVTALRDARALLDRMWDGLILDSGGS